MTSLYYVARFNHLDLISIDTGVTRCWDSVDLFFFKKEENTGNILVVTYLSKTLDGG